jgi:hypothetical protein
MTQTAFKFLAGWANPHQVKRLGRARLARWFQRQTRKAWGERRADAVVAAAEATLALWGPTGLDYEALAADIATEASSRSSSHARSLASMSGSSTSTATPTPTTSCFPSPVSGRSSPVRSAADSGTRAGSPAWPRPGRSPGSSRTRTVQDSPTPPAARPNTATPACARRCSWPPTTPARPTPPWPPATSASCARPAATTPRRCAPSPPCCAPGSLPVCATTPLPSARCRRQPDHPRPGPSDRRRALSDPSRSPCRATRHQQRPQPPPQMGRAHRARSRQALHDDARPTGQPDPSWEP